MALPLMPHATAVWLVENTALTFDQISEFCGMHNLEVQAIADGEVDIGMQGLDPIVAGQLTLEEIERCQGDPERRLILAKPDIPLPSARTKGARYTPVSKRQDRPDAIAWLLKTYPELGDAQICKLIGTTKPTINAVRDKTHWNTTNIKLQNPVSLGLCSQEDLEKAIAVARARAARAEAEKPPSETAAEPETEPAGAELVPAESSAPEVAPVLAEAGGPETPAADDPAAGLVAAEPTPAETAPSEPAPVAAPVEPAPAETAPSVPDVEPTPSAPEAEPATPRSNEAVTPSAPAQAVPTPSAPEAEPAAPQLDETTAPTEPTQPGPADPNAGDVDVPVSSETEPSEEKQTAE